MAQGEPTPSTKTRPKMPRAVYALGLVSLFTDAATEMAIPLLPVFLTSVLAAPALALGLIEGAADALAGLLKLFAGGLSDRLGKRRPLVLLGYSLSSFSRPFLALALSPLHVLLVRLVDRTGKGLRSSPRDALLAAVAPEGERAYVFSLHRAMDHTGAVIGPLLALLVLALTDGDLRTVFAATLVPGLLAVLAIVFLVKEPEAGAPSPSDGSKGRALIGRPTAEQRRLLVPLVVFGLGNATDVFLLLKVGGTRDALTALPLYWVGLHVVKAVASPLGGKLADKIGARRCLIAGWLYYALIYAGFAFADSHLELVVLFVAYGVFHALTEGPEKAMVAAMSASAERGRAFGWYHLTISLVALPAGLLFGGLWDAYGAAVAFFTGASLALAASLLLAVLTREAPRADAER